MTTGDKQMKPLKTIAAVAALLVPQIAAADTFVLVHGAFQDASGWASVSTELETMGHDVIAVDLPGRDAKGDEARAMSLELYIETIGKAVKSANDPVILVGHSFAGMTITAVADRMPDQIEKLVYVAAYVPQNGESMETLALSDPGNEFSEQTFVLAKDYSYATLLVEDQVRVFAQDSTPEQAKTLLASMIAEPLAPIGTPVELSGTPLENVAVGYVRTTADVTVSTELQTTMIERAGITDIIDIDTGHAPYLTQPVALANALHVLAN